MEIIDAFNYGIQLAAKTPEICKQLEYQLIRELDKAELEKAKQIWRDAQADKDKIYEKITRKSVYSDRGKKLWQIFEEAEKQKENKTTLTKLKRKRQTIIFPRSIHTQTEDDYEFLP